MHIVMIQNSESSSILVSSDMWMAILLLTILHTLNVINLAITV